MAAADPELRFASVAQLGRLLRRRTVSSVELTRAALERLDTAGRALNAVAELTADLALRQAAQADREIAAGRFRGPLHGIPYGAKDLLATRGIPTRWGSPAHRHQVFDHDAAVIARLADAGAILVAKVAMVELAGGGGYEYPSASLDGPGRNPWAPDRWAGGSSSGSGATVGGGLVPFAIGTETWGSITVPSAYCNVSGLRPTYGRVPRHGAMALSWTLDKIGPMARTAEDCGLILAAIAGHDPRDPSSAPGRYRFRPRAFSGRRFRLGILSHDFERHGALETRARFDAAVEVFRELGHEVEGTALPEYPYDWAAGTIVRAEGAAAFENLIRGPHLAELADLGQQAGFLAGLAVPAVEYLRALRLRTVAGPPAVAVFERFDALIAPTLLHEAPLVTSSLRTEWDDEGNGGPGNLLGWPGVSIPMGTGPNGLPLGLELIGPPDGEDTLLALGMAYQGATAWHRMRPPL